jgi:uncharacterized protein YeaO (DUF488 family)
MFRTASIRTMPTADDGLRLLVTRFRGRGVPKTLCDVWLPNLAPSERLLRTYLHGRMSWAEFSRRYRAEMLQPGGADRGNVVIKNYGQKFTLRLLARMAEQGNVTLLCHCPEDAVQCHRHLLRELILLETA